MLTTNISPVIIVYASQQGNATAIAEDLQEECTSHSVDVSLHCISSFFKDLKLQYHQTIIFIIATTGNCVQ